MYGETVKAHASRKKVRMTLILEDYEAVEAPDNMPKPKT